MKKILVLIAIILIGYIVIDNIIFSVEEVVFSNTQIKVPKPEKYENLFLDGFKDASQFMILYYNDSQKEEIIKNLNIITKENEMDVKLEYVRRYDIFSEDERRIADERFNRQEQVVIGNYYKMVKLTSAKIILIYDVNKNMLYYFSSYYH